MKPRGLQLIEDIWGFISSRLFITGIIVVCMFTALIVKLFDLQIVNAGMFVTASKPTYTRSVTVPPVRGSIYDRYGRPLAVNESTFVVKIDPSIRVSNYYDVMSVLIDIMEKNGETIIDTLPFTAEAPYEFTFNGSETKERRFKEDMTIVDTKDKNRYFNAAESFQYLRELFSVPADCPDDYARKVLNLACAVYGERYWLNHITIAKEVKEVTIAELEEHNQDLPGVYTDVSYLRIYPQGENFSHLLGYIRGINADELKVYEPLGYTAADMIGKSGAELAFELQLRGESGESVIEIDRTGRRLGVKSQVAPIAGNDVYLSIDIDYQNECAEILRKMIKTVLINKMKGLSDKEDPIKAPEVLVGLFKTNTISIEKILASEEDSDSFAIKKIIAEKSGVEADDPLYEKKVASFLYEQIENGGIKQNDVVLAMIEQGIITVTESEYMRVKNKTISIQSLLIAKVESDEITPQMANCYPATGSAIVVDVNDGSVLAAVNYPTYDNNQFVNIFNNEYFQKLNNDPTTPMINRAFSEMKPPGSTFKMISALAGLDTGVIDENTKIRDEGSFEKAGLPYAKCWTSAYGFHGTVDVRHALEVSCNYFFYETSFRFGNYSDGKTLDAISTLNKYMTMFGLGQPTGVEISEANGFISSPAYKLMDKTRNPLATKFESQWFDGDTIRTAIGQSYNIYTPAVMARYIATIANGGTRYSLRLMDRVTGPDGKLLNTGQAKVEEVLPIDQKYFNIVKEGMRLVITGNQGTARGVFKDFPIEIAGKTGTAQQIDNDHASFGCYAPYDNPEIAVYVSIPFGDSKTTVAPAAQVARDMVKAYYQLDRTPQKPEAVNSISK